MKNLIFIIADAMCDYFIDKRIGGEYVCPFLHEYAKRNIRYSNMYSEGPYTMAALKGLFSIEHAIDGNNYDAFLSSQKDDAFQKLRNEGYEMYMSLYGWFMPYSDLINMNNYNHNLVTGEVFSHEKFVIDYYINMIRMKESKLSKYYFNRLISIIRKLFDSAIVTIEKERKEGKAYISNGQVYDRDQILLMYKEEFDSFLKDEKAYIESLIDDSEGAIFNKLKDLDMIFSDKELDRLESFFRENSQKCKKLSSKQRVMNFIHMSPPIRALICYLAKSRLRDLNIKEDFKAKIVTYVKRMSNYDFDFQHMKKNNMVLSQGISSARMQLNRMSKALISRKDTGNPFFSYIHLMDTHYPFNWLSLDIPSRLYEEFNDGYNFICQMQGGEWIGNFAYLMAARYIDKCIAEFVQTLDSENKLENTVVVFTSDHGSIYGNSPLRGLSTGNNYHWESYHIPCIIADYTTNESYKTDTMHSASEMFPIIFQKLGIEIGFLNKKALLDRKESSDFAMFVYQGEGTPDIYNKPIIYGIRNKQLFLVFSEYIWNSINDDSIVAGYDIRKDSLELKVICKRKLVKYVDYCCLIRAVKEQHEKIRVNYGVV